MSKEYYRVDGIRCVTQPEADVLAERLFVRYDQTRTITITHVVEDSHEIDVRVIEATQPYKKECEFTKDMFE